MLINYRTAMYLMGVEAALEEERVPEKYLTDTCPECAERIVSGLDSEEHVVTRQSNAEGRHEVYVIIGCEGYWVVNPEVAGLPRENWQDWNDGDDMI